MSTSEENKKTKNFARFKYRNERGDVSVFKVDLNTNYEAIRDQDLQFVRGLNTKAVFKDHSNLYEEARVRLLNTLEGPRLGAHKKSISPETHFFGYIIEKCVLTHSDNSTTKQEEEITPSKALSHIRSLLPSANFRLFKKQNIIEYLP